MALLCSFFPFSASTGDEQHQFCPDSSVPTVIVNRDRELSHLLTLGSLHQNSRGRRGKEDLGVIPASASGTGKDGDIKRSKAKVGVAETEAETSV